MAQESFRQRVFDMEQSIDELIQYSVVPIFVVGGSVYTSYVEMNANAEGVRANFYINPEVDLSHNIVFSFWLQNTTLDNDLQCHLFARYLRVGSADTTWNITDSGDWSLVFAAGGNSVITDITVTPTSAYAGRLLQTSIVLTEAPAGGGLCCCFGCIVTWYKKVK